MKRFVFILTLGLAACAGGMPSYEPYFAQRDIAVPDGLKINHCRGYGCRIKDDIQIPEKEWKKVNRAMRPMARTAEQERQNIRKAIGVFEGIVGEINGSSDDIAGTFGKFGDTQMDCVDESINTTTYLAVLKGKNLLRFHEVLGPQSRVTGWPHQAGAIREIKSGETYIVDSWFHDNGIPAEIVLVDEWRSGWKPEQ